MVGTRPAVLALLLFASVSVAFVNPLDRLPNAIRKALHESSSTNVRGIPQSALKAAPAAEKADLSPNQKAFGAPAAAAAAAEDKFSAPAVRPAVRFRRVRRVVRRVGRTVGRVVRSVVSPIRKIKDGVKFLVSGRTECLVLGNSEEAPWNGQRQICIKFKAAGISGSVKATATDTNTGISASASGKDAKGLAESTVSQVIDTLSKRCLLDFSHLGLKCTVGVGPHP